MSAEKGHIQDARRTAGCYVLESSALDPRHADWIAGHYGPA